MPSKHHLAGLALIGALGLVGCPDKSSQEPRSGLRVPLPDGWKATPSATGGLHVGHAAHVTLQLETSSRELPSLEALVAAVEREKVKVINKESADAYVGVRYKLGEGEGFLGVRQTGPHTVWCSTSHGVSPEEVEASMAVCRGVSWDAAGTGPSAE